ncbi:golgin subfamily A member 6-like protein 25 isoform X1 [Mytilus edulis]|uniref:golgin subfamily A member 6-like protein 25 isoform X1 n=1 Tax=Mytilus edulis TaxID=6550 RepID=UPI0039F00C8B
MDNDIRRVRFDTEVDETILTGKWSFLRYLLTLNEEINLQIIADTLEDRGALSPDEKDVILQLYNYREKVELCLGTVMVSGPNSYTTICEVLRDCGYGHIVESLKADDEESDKYLQLVQPKRFMLSSKDRSTIHSSQASKTSKTDPLAIQGVRMAINTLSKDAKASHREFSAIITRQEELEIQLEEVMASLDNAREALIKERHEKVSLQEKLRLRDEDLVEMTKRYRELQKAMVKLKETNNKYHERIQKLQIENEEMRKMNTDKRELQEELEKRNEEIKHLKDTIEAQSKKISEQESLINDRLAVIDQLANDHAKLADGQVKLEKIMSGQSDNIARLASNKEHTEKIIDTQQQQINLQQATLVMMKEQLEKLENRMNQQDNQHNVLGLQPAEPNNRSRRQTSNSPAKQVHQKPFMAAGKQDTSKSAYWRGGEKK